MPTSSELLQSLATSAKRVMDDGVSEFRENEDSAKFIKPNEFAGLLTALADEKIAAAIDGAASSEVCRPKFKGVV